MTSSTFRIIILSTLLCFIPLASILAQSEMESDMFANMKSGDKAAIIAVHFGTTNDAARVLSIDRFNQAMQQAFPKYDFREAWTSRTIIKKVKEKEIFKQTPSEVLEQLKLDGFTHILIQSSNIVDGTEMEYLRHDISYFKKDFKEIRISQPLLMDADDYAKAIDAETKIHKDKKSINVFVCHGSTGAVNAQYTMLDYMLRDKGLTNWQVATIEGYPTMDNLIKNLKAQNIKKVNLIPFMFVAGDHVQNDIAITWKKALESKGFKVKPYTKGIGENDAIISIYVDHAKHTRKYRRYTAIEKKMQSAVGK